MGEFESHTPRQPFTGSNSHSVKDSNSNHLLDLTIKQIKEDIENCAYLKGAIFFLAESLVLNAGVVELVDTWDLKSHA